MNQQEQEKFNQIISNGYKELITKRPNKPLEHFIYYLLTSLPEEIRNKDQITRDFFEQYQEIDLKDVKEI
ncbi:unnamed protein product (macronuclear) [Paramecium tetraurelia]|uniref:RIIa domain-containing protein n=1 Tax=Paramecium tetraurelia TaxID=5888 RepID=A0CIB6_PARTE|nr:uncharacterized protein GSPATT00007668001 [Paramecium tetraurelia]CAK70533.1 unnamed protein product [Paramecium tetraurelia]|eukprot:XP_001437930.1 hypothetical protein (macronuclear) [Paramecium tetraurelia strain d4-2]